MTEQEAPKQYDGESWLNMIGYGHLKGQPSGYVKDGVAVPVERFHELCGEHAGPIFKALEHLDPTDPLYDRYINVARAAFESYVITPGDTA